MTPARLSTGSSVWGEVALMKQQCETGLRWLREKRIEGMIFLASCLCDLRPDTVEWFGRELAALLA